MSDIQITSLSQYVEIISKLQEDKYDFYFRGHSDKSYKIVPTIYRNHKLISHEDKIVREAVLRNPEEFVGLRSNFEVLSKMQHFEFPTRLLDLTENPLVALYFAISTNQRKDGSVIAFKINKEIVKYYDSDTVSILSALIKISTSKFKAFNEEFKRNILDNDSEGLKIIKQRLNKNSEQSVITTVANYVASKGIAQEVKKSLTDLFNQTTLIKYLSQEIRNEKPHFTSDIDIFDFQNHIIYVRSKYDTKRIAAQQGSFLLFGIKEGDKLKHAQFEKKQIETTNYIVPFGSKKSLLQELAKFGISHERLFPEITNSAKVIRSKFDK